MSVYEHRLALSGSVFVPALSEWFKKGYLYKLPAMVWMEAEKMSNNNYYCCSQLCIYSVRRFARAGHNIQHGVSTLIMYKGKKMMLNAQPFTSAMVACTF